MNLLRSWLRAIQAATVFMTVLPIPYPENLGEREKRWSQYFYPLIGLLLGLVLWAVAGKLPGGTMLSSAVLLVIWVTFSGALHLDGLADCADAWVGGMGDREKTLRILKDPAAGSMAVVALFLLLLLKFIAIDTLILAGYSWFLVAVPVLARCTPMFLFSTTQYVREGGIGHDLQPANRGRLLPWAVLCGVLVAFLFWIGIVVFWVLLPIILGFIFVRSFSIQRLGGFTGDVAGAVIEISEVMACVVLALLVS